MGEPKLVSNICRIGPIKTMPGRKLIATRTIVRKANKVLIIGLGFVAAWKADCQFRNAALRLIHHG
jgi:hypothetical protein